MFLQYFYNWGNVAQWVSAAGLILFFILYTTFAKWWKDPVGWVVNVFVISLVLIILPSLISLAFPAEFARFAITTWYKVLETVNLTFLAASAIVGNTVWLRLHKYRRLPGEKDGSKKA